MRMHRRNIRKRSYLLFMVVFFAKGCFAQQPQPNWHNHLDFEALEHRLYSEPVASMVSLESYFKKKNKRFRATHDILLVTLESGLKGIFKVGNYSYAEVAAYRLSELIGIHLVPPTVLRTINGTLGSLQFYIADAIEIPNVSFQKKLLKKIDAKVLHDMKLFYYIAGQWDTHVGNQIIVADKGKNHLALIDNAALLYRSFSRYGGPTFVEKGDNSLIRLPHGVPFPFNEGCTINDNLKKELFLVFKPFLSTDYILSFARFDSITYIVWNDILWIGWKDRHRKRFTKYYYRSTLEAFSKLTRKDLESVWHEWCTVHPEHANELIHLFLARRDEVLRLVNTDYILDDTASL